MHTHIDAGIRQEEIQDHHYSVNSLEEVRIIDSIGEERIF